LTDAEWKVIKMHATFAYNLLYPIRHLRPALDIPYCHHEWRNGGGYPRGLSGIQIPIAARIFALVDGWDALNSDRPYCAAWKGSEARDYILSCAGTHFDPDITKEFIQFIDAK
jgi:putative two-component system response regulator